MSNPYFNEKIVRSPDRGSPPLGAGNLPPAGLAIWGASAWSGGGGTSAPSNVTRPSSR
jgi:hypothetical protein